MNVPVIAFFNNKGGVGKTSLVYHLSWMYADLGYRVVAADLDPQANLTSAFLDDDRLEELWSDSNHAQTIYGSIGPLIQGTGDITSPHLEYVDEPTLFGSSIALLVGDLQLSNFENELSEVWPKCLEGNPRAFRVTSAFWRIIQLAAEQHRANVVLMDLGPNLSAINRAALIAADYVVVPLSPDLYSLQGLHNLGPTLRRWHVEWKERLAKNNTSHLQLPPGTMKPVGYIVLQHAVRMDRPVKAYDRWLAQIPGDYRTYVLDKSPHQVSNITVTSDPYQLALLKDYRILMPLAQEARKPMFHLRPADGAIGSHLQAVQSAYLDFETLARKIAEDTGISPSA